MNQVSHALPNVVIAGGGICGLSLALFLSKSKFNVTVLERSPSHAKRDALGGGIGLWPPSQLAFQRVGLLDKLKKLGEFMATPAYLDEYGNTLAKPLPHFHDRFPILCLEREDLCAELWNACVENGVELKSDIVVTGVHVDDNNNYSMVTDAGEQIIGDLLIGADGIHSNVRNAIQQLHNLPEVSVQHCGYTYYRAVLDSNTLEQQLNWHDYAFESWGTAKRFGYVPLGKGKVFWFSALDLKQNNLSIIQGSRQCDEDIKSMLLNEFGNYQSPLNIEMLLKATPASSILRTDINKVVGVERFPWSSPDRKLVLVGDSAHATSPNLAQGAGLAIEDAATLSSLLLQKFSDLSSISSAIEEYERQRKPRAATVQRIADLVALVGQLPFPFDQFRNYSMRFASHAFPHLQQQIFEQTVSYSLGGKGNSLHWNPSSFPRGTFSPPLSRECLLGKSMGEDIFDNELHKTMQQFRRSKSGGEGSGSVSVSRSVFGSIFGLPKTKQKTTFHASVQVNSDETQTWTRIFGSNQIGATAYSTIHSAVQSSLAKSGCVLTESVGTIWPLNVIKFGYKVESTKENGASFQSVGLWLYNLPLPLPNFLLPSSKWTENPLPDGSGWFFDGVIQLFGHTLMKYSGEFRPTQKHVEHNSKCAIVAGGTGLVGNAVCEEFYNAGYTVVVLTRKPPVENHSKFVSRFVKWDGKTAKNWSQIIEPGMDITLINLSGKNAGESRWTKETKQEILNSRIDSINAMDEAINVAHSRGAEIKWIQASAVGIYGSRGNEILTEVSDTADTVGFRSTCCNEIEAATLGTKANANGTPVYIVRLGHVLSAGGGLLPYIEFASMCGASKFGDGKQYVPWIHIADAAKAIRFACEEPNLAGQPINVVAPTPVTNAEFLKTMAVARERNSMYHLTIPLPSSMLSTIFGESAIVLTDSENTQPQSLLNYGFKFSYPHLKEALTSDACVGAKY